MEELGARIYGITEESFSVVDNYFTKNDLEDIRTGRLSAVAGVIEDTVDGVMLFEVKDNREARSRCNGDSQQEKTRLPNGSIPKQIPKRPRRRP